MALGEARRGVGTHGHREHVLIVIGIHGAPHPRDESALPVVVVLQIGFAQCRRDVVVLEILCRNVLAACPCLLEGGLLGRVHAHEVDLVLLGEGAVVGDEVFHGPVARLVLQYGGRAGLIDVGVVDASSSEGSRLRRTEVQTHVDAIAQALNPWALHLAEERVVGAHALVLVEPDVLQVFHHVLRHDESLIHGHVDGALERAVVVVLAGQRAHAQHVVETNVGALGDAVAIVGGESESEPLAHHLVEVSAHAHAIISLSRNHGLVVVVARAEAVAAALRAAGDAHVVIVAHARLVEVVLPVGVGLVALLEGVLIESGLLAHLGKRGAVHHGIAVEERLEAHVAVVAHLGRRALAALHGGDDDHAVGTARTVDGGCRGVLQDVHRLDVGGVDVGELPHEGDAVEHDERVVGGRERALTADADLHLGTRLRAGLRHEHTGHAALQCLGSVGGSHLIELLAADVGHRTGDGLAALRAIANHHHLIEAAALVLELHVDGRLRAHTDFLSHIANVAHHEGGSRLHRERVAAVHVGHGAVAGALLHDGGADERPHGVADAPRHRLLLIHGGRSPQPLSRQHARRAQPHAGAEGHHEQCLFAI